jgi:hypothetical protein
MRVLKAGLLYFGLVFTAGFVLGPIRIQWAVPRFGSMTAELLEMPIMLVVIILTSRWTVRRLAIPSVPYMRVGIGLIALGLLVTAELTVVLSLRGLSIAEYVANRNPISVIVYIAMLCAFTVMPLLIARR